MTPEETALELYKGDQQIIELATARFNRCKTWESTAQARWLNDQKTANADPVNLYQWPNQGWTQRRDDPNGYKPRLTVNKIRQHNRQITNDQKQNPIGIKISPVGDEATFEAAKIWMGLVRHIERVSKAQQAYTTASTHQVECGLGYIKVKTDYIPGTFEQEMYICRVKNPLNIFLDPDHNEMDGSDSRFGFEFDMEPRTETVERYPQIKNKTVTTTLGNSMAAGGMMDMDHVMVVDYYAKRQKKDRLVMMYEPDEEGKPTDNMIVAKWSRIPPKIRDHIDEKTIIRSRDIMSDEVWWYKIIGEEIVDKERWPGQYIPIVPVIGEETIIEGQLDRKGHTRNLIDAQRIYNFWSSSAVEHVSLQTKSRWWVPVGATENLETYLATLNKQNYPFLPYHAMDADGNPLPAPIEIEPPIMADGYIKGMMISREEFGMASGQREENFGQQSNAVSGRAINERKVQGDNATYQFPDNLSIAIRHVGNIILDAAPNIYTSKQIKQILAEDGSEQLIQIDPSADVAYAEEKRGDKTFVIFNPKVGRYWVDSDTGPSYGTKRQEAWNAFVQITSQNQQLVTQIGDIMFSYADFPGADEIRDRLRRMVPPALKGDGPSPDLIAAQQQNEQLKGLLADMTEKLAKQELELKDRDGKLKLERYRVESERLKDTADAEAKMLSPEMLRPVIEQLIREMTGMKVPATNGAANGTGPKPPPESEMNGANGYEQDPIVQPAGGGQAASYESDPIVQPANNPPIAGARRAPDGEWYARGQDGRHVKVSMQ